jgi:hypothetical protein
MPPTPFLRPNALISVINPEAAACGTGAPMVNPEILKIS